MPGDDRDQWAKALSDMANGVAREQEDPHPPMQELVPDAPGTQPEGQADASSEPKPPVDRPAASVRPSQPQPPSVPFTSVRPPPPNRAPKVTVIPPLAPPPVLGKSRSEAQEPSTTMAVSCSQPPPDAPALPPRSRPAAPVLVQETFHRESTPGQPQADPQALAHVQEGDDMIPIPPAPPELLAARRPSVRTHRIARPPFYAGLYFRQTLIPILLTTGLLFMGLGVGWFLVGPDSVFKTPPLGLWLPITLLVMGLGLLGFGVMNMLQVGAELQRQASGLDR